MSKFIKLKDRESGDILCVKIKDISHISEKGSLEYGTCTTIHFKGGLKVKVGESANSLMEVLNV